MFRTRVSLLLTAALAICPLPAVAGTSPVSCDVSFSLDSGDSFMGAQFDVDYSAAGGAFTGAGQMVACTNLLAGSLAAPYDDDGSSTLTFAFITLSSVTGPTNLATCTFTAAVAPVPPDFPVTMVDDYDTTGIAGGNVCGAPMTGSSPPYARDALTVLQTAVGQFTLCQDCECDVNSDGNVTATDSLLTLRAAAGWPVSIGCPPCMDPPAVSAPTTSVGVTVSVDCSVCGDGVVEGSEGCDDMNSDPFDCCDLCVLAPEGGACQNGDECGGDTCDDGECIAGTDASACDDGSPCTVETCNVTCSSSFEADETCETGSKASLSITDSSDDAKDSLKWKLGGGPQIEQADLGDPVGGTIYTLCLYDSTGGLDNHVMEASIPAGAGWTDKAPKGFLYKDAAGTLNGVTKAKLKTGAAGKSKLSIAAKGANLELPAPFSADDYFDQDTRVTLQLHNTTSSSCWSTVFDSNKLNTGAKFKAKEP